MGRVVVSLVSCGLLAFVSPEVSAATEAAGGRSDPHRGTIELRLTGGTFRPDGAGGGVTVPVAPEWFRTTGAGPIAISARGRRYLVAVTRAPLSPGERRLLEAAGATPLDYLPVRGYRV